ncbi:alpha/beta hydrolase [Desulfuromonas sp. TF]|uniref:alpha/beta hydrolase n=1 Tax=Desulfuromonas sp. TF TaxID=1232410 RepID=UPI0003F4BA58|nr:alpha/beta hydrolase [Desulfuromonas sp. TF]
MTGELLDHPLITQRYFFPRPSALADPLWVDAGDVRLACHLHQVEGAARTLVLFPGNGEIVDDYLGDFVELIGRMGCSTFLVGYRGYGRSQGQPQLGRMLADVDSIVRVAGDPRRLIFFGRSVGSIFAIEAAARFPEAAGLVLESGIADVLERLLLRVDPEELGASPEALAGAVAERLDHRRKLARFPGPVLVMHTRHDGLVDVSHGERLYRWAAGKKQMEVFPRGDHNSIMAVNAREYFDLLERFVEELSC